MNMYYAIDENSARLAHEMMSMTDYQEGWKTQEYRHLVDVAAAMAEREKKRKPDYAGVIDDLLDRYARKMAEWMNTESRIGMMCPSVLIAGPSNFPVRKKQKQNARMDAHAAKREQIDKLLDKIRNIGTGGIKANDEHVIMKLEAKLEDLTDFQELMKGVNAYYRKNKTLEGCDLLTQSQIEKITASLSSSWRSSPVPFEAYELSNNNAEIRRIKCRIEEIKKIKDQGDSESEVEDIDGLKVVEDTSLMRIQLVFGYKPDANIRSILKSYGFRWAPSQHAWQRQLNQNGRHAAKMAIKQITSLNPIREAELAE